MSQITGALVNLTSPDEGDTVYRVTQTDLVPFDPKSEEYRGEIRQIDWSFGPVKVTGTFNADDFGLAVTPSYMGIQAGELHGDLKDGVWLYIDYFYAKGKHGFYLKNGNELWTSIDIKITFDGHFQGDYKIISI